MSCHRKLLPPPRILIDLTASLVCQISPLRGQSDLAVYLGMTGKSLRLQNHDGIIIDVARDMVDERCRQCRIFERETGVVAEEWKGGIVGAKEAQLTSAFPVSAPKFPLGQTRKPHQRK
jgi:hypothetical protein